ncbi:UDP-N-acetylglucosamine transferase subunit ALG14 homolog [Cyanistes caeruleus]|uniref:UDP-N-acetylglucosamine transferase subunit ALG14 homolog n=1 Tax=Cyanistes caeruleus TaxID=156563 RepID=UPI000CDB553A|nr:UDP-N-acetylglucosamine transferase subunit ALG14 homolog [Cyanistes caeruleus]
MTNTLFPNHKMQYVTLSSKDYVASEISPVAESSLSPNKGCVYYSCIPGSVSLARRNVRAVLRQAGLSLPALLRAVLSGQARPAGPDSAGSRLPPCFSGTPAGGQRVLFSLDRIPRSREVRQSWISSVVTTLYSVLYSLPLTYKRKPDLILCNGPGTCVPVCLSAFLLGLLRIKRTIIVYVESICRVETLSLSGKILYYFSDYFIVQWPDLKKKYPKSVYLGRIV